MFTKYSFFIHYSCMHNNKRNPHPPTKIQMFNIHESRNKARSFHHKYFHIYIQNHTHKHMCSISENKCCITLHATGNFLKISIKRNILCRVQFILWDVFSAVQSTVVYHYRYAIYIRYSVIGKPRTASRYKQGDGPIHCLLYIKVLHQGGKKSKKKILCKN